MADPRGTDDRDDEAVRRFIEHSSAVFASWGFPLMSARVLMTMMCAEDDGLSAIEISETLGASAAATSGALRHLTDVRLLTREPVPGSRRDLYRMTDDAWYASSATKGEVYRAIADTADGGVRALGGQDTVAGRRVAEMRDFLRFVDVELSGLLERWERIRDRS